MLGIITRQAWAGVWDIPRLSREVERGMLELEAIIGQPVRCSAVAGWRADQRVVKAKEHFAFRYNSDCRGTGPFCRCWAKIATVRCKFRSRFLRGTKWWGAR